MKYLYLILITVLFACNNNSGQAKIYEDSVTYYSNKLTALTDSGFSMNDSMKQMQKTRIFIYQTMREYYIGKWKEVK